jgi:DNA-binding CsgD family transcriptional regulator
MYEIIYIIILFLCIAVSAGGLLQSLKMKKRVGESYFMDYFLVLVFFSVYGLYGLWGPGFVKFILSVIDKSELFSKISRFLAFMAIPFLVSGWYMMVSFTTKISGKTTKTSFVILLFVLVLLVVISSAVFNMSFPQGFPINDLEKTVITVINMLFFFINGIIILLIKQENSYWKASRPVFWIGFGYILTGIIQTISFVLFQQSFWYYCIALLLFFISLLIPVYILVRSPLIHKKPGETSKSFETFCRKFEISPREAEVIREICLGKANKEIADTLFITLQTVKDHIHNIFSKTDVKSRIQLANLAREQTEIQ